MTFDVFGTIVDWRGTIAREGSILGASLGIQRDWEAFADEWRDGYGPSMDRVREGDLPWTKIDDLHRMILDGLLERYGLSGLDEPALDHLNRVWHRLDPWPDSVGGLTRLKSNYTIATLSNGNVSLLTNMAKHAGLPWDCILSAELGRHYKPDPETYLAATEFLSEPPENVMMVAAHKGDLRAAASVGFRIGFVQRPFEHDPERTTDLEPEDWMDVWGRDLHHLAGKLGC